MTTKAKQAKATPATSPSRISEVAMLVNLRQGIWRAVRTDDQITQEVADRHNSRRDMGVYKKFLLDPEVLKPGYKILGEARYQEHNRLTLPWQDGGYRILSNAGYFTYMEKMRAKQTEYEAWVRQDFVPNYPRYKAAAKQALNGMFKETDYPSPDNIAGKFYFKVDVFPLPDASDFRVELGDAETARLRSTMQQDINATLQQAVQDVWGRLQQVVSHMVERLKGYTGKGQKGSFRDTLVTNIVEMVDLVPVLNIANDPNLAAFAARIREELTAYQPEVLRDDERRRKDVARCAEEILSKMEAFVA